MKKAQTQTAKTGNDGEPAFSAGDIVKFGCENGYEIQGYTTVTCSGNFNTELLITPILSY